MVRRRGVYNVHILGKQLMCLFCQGELFRHSEVYMDLQGPGMKVEDRLTLQCLYCEKCGDVRMFEERKVTDEATGEDVSSMTYTEVVGG